MAIVQSKVNIIKINDYSGIGAVEKILKDDIIFYLQGRITNKPNLYTIQVDVDKHIELPLHITDVFENPFYYWRYLNHSCTPNCYCNVEDFTFRAKRDIEPGEHIVFNYNATEYKMSLPFKCLCGSDNCVGDIRGFKYLTEKQRQEILPEVARHLVSLHEKENIEVF